MGLFDTLDMGNVDDDPNALPDGKWVGEVYKSELVEKKNGAVSHVITYRVTEGERNGAQPTEWFELGTDAVRDENNRVVDFKTPTMPEDKKRWYKMRWANLGKPLTAESKISDLVGIPINFGTKRNGNFTNINFVEPRTAAEPTVGNTSENRIGSL